MKNFPQGYHEETEISDEILARFFDAKESGKSFPDALLAAGVTDQVTDLSEFHALWDMHGNFMREAHNISPRESLLDRTLSALPHPASGIVTNPSDIGYNGGSAQHVLVRIINNFHTMSQMNWKIAAPIAVLVLAVVAVVGMRGDTPTAKLAVNDVLKAEPALMDAGGVVENSGEEATPSLGDAAQDSRMAKSIPATSALPATGEADDLVAALVSEASIDVSLLDTASSDLSVVMTDSQTLNDLSTAYDETTF